MSNSAVGRRGERRYSGPSRSRALEASPIEKFVDQLVLELGLESSASDVRSKRLIRRLAEFATAAGLALERDLVFDPDTIERFCSVALHNERSAATYRAVLRSIAPRVTKYAPWEPAPKAFARRMLALPYLPLELDVLVDDIANQPTRSRRRAGRVLFSLGLGAGLDGRWAAKVGAGDVACAGGVVLIRVGEPNARCVPVCTPYAEAILELAESAGEDALVGGRSTSKNRTGHLVASLLVPTGHVALSPARLRSTWLLGHLIAGTPIVELCAAAGLVGPSVLSDLFEFVPRLSPTRHAAALAGREQ